MCARKFLNQLEKYPGVHFLDHVGFPGGTSDKEAACQCRRHKRRMFNPWVGKIPWRGEWKPTPVFLPGESHGWRSLAGHSPRGRTESATAEHAHILLHILSLHISFFSLSFVLYGSLALSPSSGSFLCCLTARDEPIGDILHFCCHGFCFQCLLLIGS